MKFCMECGTQLPQRARFCSNCGLQLTDEPAVVWAPASDEDVPELHEPPVPAAPPEQHFESTLPPPPIATPVVEREREPVAESEREPDRFVARAPEPEIPPPVPHVREPYAREPFAASWVLPWEEENRDDLVPPPAAAYAPETEDVEAVPTPVSPYADEPPHDPDAPPPMPLSDDLRAFLRDDHPPPYGDGIEIPNAPPEAPAPPPPPGRQNWIMRHKLVAATTAVVSAVIIAAALNSASDTPSRTQSPFATQSPSSAQSPSAASPGVQGSAPPGAADQVVGIGNGATINGLSATVTSAIFQQSIDEMHLDGYILADVAYANSSGQSKPFNSLDWKIRPSTGTATASESIGADGYLTSGDIADGGSVTGRLAFKVGAQKGEFQIIWKPDAVDPGRGIWTVTI